MLLRNTPGQGIFLYARIFATGLGKTGDATNITGAFALDGADTPGFATAHPTEMSGGRYWQPLTAAETNGNAYSYGWTSTTSGVVIEPVSGFTQLCYDGILAAATSSTVTFPEFDSLGTAIPDSGQFAFTGLFISGGTGASQTVLLLGPTANPREYAVIPTTMPVPCDDTSQYQLLGTTFSYGGTLATASSTTVTLPEFDSLGAPIPDDGRFADSALWIAAGAGARQWLMLAGRAANPREYHLVADSMHEQVDGTSRYQLFRGLLGRSDPTQPVPTSNTAQTHGDCLNAARADGFGKGTIVTSGGVTTETLYAPDGSTPVKQFTLDDPINPTSRVPV